MILLELDYPPSINHYYRNFNGRVILSKAGREYREKVAWILKQNKVKAITGDISMRVDLYPPDSRRRDIDNVQKALWDALEYGGAYRDDSQIKHFECFMREPLPPHGAVLVEIEQEIK